MASVFIGQLMLVPYNFPPRGFAFCQGQLMSISQNTALFSLLGTYYGGDGRTTFGLPNLQGTCALSQGQGPGLSPYDVGQTAGSENITVIATEVPPHNHTVMATTAADQSTPVNNGLGQPTTLMYSDATSGFTPMTNQVLTIAGGSQPHNNMMPYQVLNWIIALLGVFPARS